MSHQGTTAKGYAAQKSQLYELHSDHLTPLALQWCPWYLELCKYVLLDAWVHNLISRQLNDDVAKNSPFHSGLLLSIFSSCLAHLKNTKNTKEEISQCIDNSHELGKKISMARKLGHSCAKKAVWIPVTR